MENATRALVMAGGILIGILILGALMLMFNSIGAYQTNKNDSDKLTEITQFNNQFEPYNKDGLTLMELKSVYNKILNNNKTSKYIIESNLLENEANAKNIINSDDDDGEIYSDFMNNFNNISEKQKINRRFKCIIVEYDSSGRINRMNFSKS